MLLRMRRPCVPGNPKRRIPLTKRETDVVKLLVEGLSNREMAGQLRLTEHTVSNHLFRIYQKLGISTRVDTDEELLRQQYRLTPAESAVAIGEQ
jgi:DNA-binding CsgD family transcriptional regulator